MPMLQITWDDVQRRFGDEPPAERFVDSVPVRLGSEGLGAVDLTGVFSEG